MTADTATFYRVWFGWMLIGEALDEGTIQLDGALALVRALPSWLKLSHFASAVRAVIEAQQRNPVHARRV